MEREIEDPDANWVHGERTSCRVKRWIPNLDAYTIVSPKPRT